jgi:hypothetical protein
MEFLFRPDLSIKFFLIPPPLVAINNADVKGAETWHRCLGFGKLGESRLASWANAVSAVLAVSDGGCCRSLRRVYV